MATREYQGRKYTAMKIVDTLDYLTVEEALKIKVNDVVFTITMRSPGDDQELIRGLLHNEGVLKSKTYSPEIVFSKDKSNVQETIANVIVNESELNKEHTNSRSLLSVSSCGICGKTELEELNTNDFIPMDNELVDAEIISGLFDKMNTFQKSFHQSGGTHAAAAFTNKGELICSFEDIGRHNAVDKVVGDLLLKKEIKKAKCLTVSGRISYEIIIKCFKARIPIIAAVSAPSSLAVDFAKELGISLFAFCREERLTCYSHPERVLNWNKENNMTSEVNV